MPKVDLTTWQHVETGLRNGARVIEELLDQMAAGWPKEGRTLPGYPFHDEAEVAEALESLADEVRDYEENQERLAEERAARGFTETNSGRLADPDCGPEPRRL